MIDPRNPRSSAAKNKSIGIIVLAAGASVRMRQPKQLLEFQGKRLLRRAAETALESVYSPVIVTLGANYEKTRAEIEDLPVEIVFNSNWRDGLSSSIKCGVEILLKIAPDISAMMITLADQPLITANQLNIFAERFEQTKASVIAAEYNDTLGVPALFAREIFDDFNSLTGDKGAKPIIEKHRDSLLTVNLPEAAFDIDTPQDLMSGES